MIKHYKVKYLGKPPILDVVEARCPKDALKQVVKIEFFTAEEVE